MTRFARAKGSKSSNERTPEDSTPWQVMKEQLLQAKVQSEEAKKREEAEKQRIENYENFLKEHKTQKRKATWCDFPEVNKAKPEQSNAVPPLKKNKNKEGKVTVSETQTQGEVASQNNVKNFAKKKSKKKKQFVEPNEQANDVKPDNSECNSNDTANKDFTQVSSKKNKNHQKHNLEEPSGMDIQNSGAVQNQDSNVIIKKNNKKNKKRQEKHFKKVDDNSQNQVEANQNKQHNNSNLNNQKTKKKKETKFVNGEPVRRKPIDNRSFQLIINGKEVELVRFDGFPIMKKDAERLEELKSNMIKKGIPKSEVNRTLKLERRRAEKALARLKRDVCYNCRKGGHNLSDCPELKTKIPGVGAPDGVCFKCGSTEHRQFECKVQKDKEFRFATCFICKEPGHIARQCPDNPKGLYPNGGGCKLCGDVTHLRKDCPTMMGKKEETSMKLQTLDSTDTLEGIEQNNSINTDPQETIKKPKKIKF